ncbi:MAG: hypothetical protein H6581_19800 [Bacteroidia bacterium]|nr:hypothetical protein [Bacteroidia bacterium]
MLKKHLTLLLLLCLLGAKAAFADSPLTSTDFWTAYQDIPEVKHASEAGMVDQEIALFLAKKEIPLDQKMAACNALGWTFEGKQNHEILLERWGIKVKAGKALEPKSLKKLRPDQQLCVAYLMALDDYFKPDRALPFVEQAAKGLKTSYVAQMIRGLIRAQVAFDSDWCTVWKEAEAVDTNESLERDLRPEAITTIMDYMVLYQGDCK